MIHLIIAAFFLCCFAAPLMKLTALEEWELPELSSSTQAAGTGTDSDTAAGTSDRHGPGGNPLEPFFPITGSR